MTAKEVAVKMMDCTTVEQYHAIKMMGCEFDIMTPEQRVLAAECIAAFHHLIESEK